MVTALHLVAQLLSTAATVAQLAQAGQFGFTVAGVEQHLEQVVTLR
jgi:hypothetical protein